MHRLKRIRQLNEAWWVEIVRSRGGQHPVLAVVDLYGHDCLTFETLNAVCFEKIRDALERLITKKGAPEYFVAEEFSILATTDFVRWTADNGMQVEFLRRKNGSRVHHAGGAAGALRSVT